MSKNYFSIDYRDMHEEISADDFDDQIVSKLAEMAENENVLYDVEPDPCAYFYDADEILCKTLEPALKKFLSETTIRLHNADASTDEFNANKYFDDVWDYFYGGENSSCRAADLISVSVENFIAQGKWQCGLKSTEAEDKPHFVIWFGLPDEEPLSYWTIDPCAADSVEQWFTEMDWSDILSNTWPIGSWGDCVMFWAAEGGIDLPDRSKLLRVCW